MTAEERLIARFLSYPKTFKFKDFVKVMTAFGFELDQKGRTSGSRVRFYRKADGRMYIMHTPHPSIEMSRGAIQSAAQFLRTVGRPK